MIWLSVAFLSIHSHGQWPPLGPHPNPPLLLVSTHFPTSIVFLGFQHCLSHRYYCVTPVVKTFNGFLIVHPLSTGQIQILLISLKDQSKSGQNTFLVLLIEAALIPDSLFKCRFQPFSSPRPSKPFCALLLICWHLAHRYFLFLLWNQCLLANSCTFSCLGIQCVLNRWMHMCMDTQVVHSLSNVPDLLSNVSFYWF